jgi:hypothetical protein
MEAMKKHFAPLKTFFTILIAFSPVFCVTAQNIQYRDPAFPEKGHWQIVTDPAANNTVIKFYDGQKNQIYEETISGKYIKLTDRNIARINKTFDQIAGKTMVLAQVKSDPFTSPAFRKLSYRHLKKRSLTEKESTKSALNSASRLKVHAFQYYPTARFELNFQNPAQERLIIKVFNKVGQSVYHESSCRMHYKRSFDFEGMANGMYKLVVTTANGKFKYTKQIEIKPQTKPFPEKQPEPILVTSNEQVNRQRLVPRVTSVDFFKTILQNSL